ncbi:MAG: sulfite exporter TauE/SafE family protein [Vicinamibacterales bacterium]
MNTTDLIFAGAVGVVSLISGATAAVVGFGIGSLLTPLLITRVDPHLAVSLIAIPHAIATAARYVQHRTFVDSSMFLRFGVPSAAGGLLGAVFQGAIPARWLIVVLGALLIATGAASLRLTSLARTPPQSLALVLGALSGFFGGLAGNQGGFRTAGLSAFSLPPRAFLATSTAVGLVVDLARTPVYLARSGSALTEFVPMVVIASAGCLAGTILGERIFLGMPADRYRRVVGGAVVAIGLWLCTQGARS